MNFFDAVLQAVNTLVQQNLGIFDGMGQNLFRAFATILVVWYGVKAALAAGEHRGGFHFANFVTLILMISFGFAMVNYYDAPIPGFGRDFHHLITDEAASLSNQIGQANAQRIADDTGYVLGNLEAPGITQPIATFLYALLWLAAVATEGLALIVVAFGVVATAVCILLGPVFIPFFIVPQLDWLFWGWLKAFIQYSFYQVVAAGVLYIVSQFTFGIIHAQITGLISQPTSSESRPCWWSCTWPPSTRLSKSRCSRVTSSAVRPADRLATSLTRFRELSERRYERQHLQRGEAALP